MAKGDIGSQNYLQQALQSVPTGSSPPMFGGGQLPPNYLQQVGGGQGSLTPSHIGPQLGQSGFGGQSGQPGFGGSFGPNPNIYPMLLQMAALQNLQGIPGLPRFGGNQAVPRGPMNRGGPVQGNRPPMRTMMRGSPGAKMEEY